MLPVHRTRAYDKKFAEIYATGMQRSILAGSAANRTPNPRKVHKMSRWKLLLLGAGLALFLLWLLRERWVNNDFDWAALGRSFYRLDWRWLGASVVLILLSYVGRALRWRVMLRPLRPDPDFRKLLSATVIGFTAVTLLGRPGEFVRPYLISRTQSVPFSSQIAAWFLERIWDMLAVMLIFGYALAHIENSRATVGPRLQAVLEIGGYLIGAIALVCLFLLLMLGRFSAATRDRLIGALGFLPDRYEARIERSITTFIEGAAATKTRGGLFLMLSYTIAEWCVIVLALACLFWAYPATAQFGFADVLTFTGFLAFGGLVQIPGIGGGAQIVTIVVLEEMFKVPLAVATGMAIVIWVLTFVVIVPVGLGCAFHEGLNWRQLRALEREAAQSAGGETPA
jgi:uncharacterized protein (TIRG00374 family)